MMHDGWEMFRTAPVDTGYTGVLINDTLRNVKKNVSVLVHSGLDWISMDWLHGMT